MVLSRSEFSFIRYPYYSADRGCSWSRFFKLIPLQNLDTISRTSLNTISRYLFPVFIIENN